MAVAGAPPFSTAGELSIPADEPDLQAPSRSNSSEDAQLTVYTAFAEDGSAHKVNLRRRKPKEESLFGLLCAWTVEHQLGMAVNLLLLLALTHVCFPRARQRTRKYFELSYYDSSTETYARGMDDLSYVFFWIVVLTGLRAFTVEYVLKPFAAWGGLKKKARVRFAEQGWLLIYYSIFVPVGLYLWYNSKFWLNTWELWTNYPAKELGGLTKRYYLLQFAFWLQQIVMVNIEERRKDHWQMFSHHVITSTLLVASYGWYMTHVGVVILVLMDSVDIVFGVAKISKYFGFTTACDVAFAVFMISWVVNRHIGYMMAVYSVHLEMPAAVGDGCWSSTTGARLSTDGGSAILANVLQPFINPDGAVCYNNNIRRGFLGLLLGLQVIMIVWFGMIMRVAWRVINGQGADDTRSDDEEEALEADEPEQVSARNIEKGKQAASPLEMQPPLEEEVGAEGLNFTRRPSPMRQFRKPSGRTSGISLPGHPDRKELLGRIGCEKPV